MKQRHMKQYTRGNEQQGAKVMGLHMGFKR
jgi:hypothetical protein